MNPKQLPSNGAAGPFKSGGENADPLLMRLTKPILAVRISPGSQNGYYAPWENRLTFQPGFSSVHMLASPQQ
jgi:hypothetical protein